MIAALARFFFIGFAMGAANVVPGVSGGTIAFITNVFERLVNAIKSFNGTALKLLFSFRIKEFLLHIDFVFLAPLLAGTAVSIVSLAILLEKAFNSYPVLVWAFFFGLILGSIPFLFKMVEKWNAGAIVGVLLGIGIAVATALLNPAQENPAMWYVFICGMLAISSMILPGISGSFILILLGNYQLIVLHSIKALDLSILIPFAVGCGMGIIAFSHLLSWVMKTFRNTAIGLLTGFVAGSLMVIWPWKQEEYLRDADGELIMKEGEKIVQGYNWQLPEAFGGDLSSAFQGEAWLAVGLMVLGFAAIVIMERSAKEKPAADHE